MITFICREYHRYTGDSFAAHFHRQLAGRFQVLSYEQLFRAHALPVGHLIFTDLDRLTPYLREVAANMAAALVAVAPEARILNHPLRVKERYALLRALRLAGINDFDVARLDEGRRPERFPVFIRREDDALGPETGLIADAAAFDLALANLSGQRPLKGRIWIEYRAAPDPDGHFRKYGAFRIGDHIMPYHMQVADGWIVKRSTRELQDANDAEELAFIRTDPHAAEVRRAFEIAEIDFGRADYTVVDGKVRIYEINTNPSLPKQPQQARRAERRALVRGRFLEWLLALDTPVGARGWVTYRLPEPVQEPLPKIGRRSLRLFIAGRWLARSPRSGRWRRKAG